MPGEILAEDNSPMMLTVGQYNSIIERVVNQTIDEASKGERERLVKLLKNVCDCERLQYLISHLETDK